MKKTLFVYNLWWAFGSHLLHIKWAMIHAIKNNYEFFYRYNINRIFPNKTIEYYFEPISTISESVLEPEDLVQYLTIWKNLDPIERYAYKPDEFHTVEEFHQYVLRKFYKPNSYVKNIIDNNKTIKFLREQKIKYIGVHIRLGDKVSGPEKETDYIDLNVYMNYCLKIREATGINTIVICSDTNEALDTMNGYNKQIIDLGYSNFDIYWNEDEKRCSNQWFDSVTHRANCNLMSVEELEKEYLTCFINFQLLLEAEILVGNFDSGFILAAVEYRNNGKDINVNHNNNPKWGIGNKSGW
jgi:hypothetical protein